LGFWTPGKVGVAEVKGIFDMINKGGHGLSITGLKIFRQCAIEVFQWQDFVIGLEQIHFQFIF
jgi:hypothetical protein